MTEQNNYYVERLKSLEDTIQSHKADIKELKDVVTELREIVRDIDKNAAIEIEKRSHMEFRIEHLQKEIELLEANGVKSGDKQRALVENALMVLLGGLISYLFGLISGK